MARLIRAELFKLRKRGLTWILLAIMVGIMIVINLLLLAISKITLPRNPAGMADLQNVLNLASSIPFTLTILASFGAVMSVILMASSVGNEFNWRTLRIALISCESRPKLLASKIISVSILIIIGMLVSLAVGFLMSLITNTMSGRSLDFGFLSSGYLWDQFLQFWRTLFIIMPFALMGLFFSVLGRSAMPGIAVGAGILFLEPVITALMTVAGGWISSIPQYLFAANVNAIKALNSIGGIGPFAGAASQAPSVPHAYIALGLYMLVFLGGAFYLFIKRDATG